MTKLTAKFFLILTFWTLSQARGQEPVAANGKFATVKGIKIYYEESGKGMPLILLNPFNSTISSWKPFISEFSKYFRVIAIEIPGHCRSDAIDTTSFYSFKKAADYILNFIDDLGLDSLNIIGASSPSSIALYIATMRPALVKNLVIIGGQAYFAPQTRAAITSWGPGFENKDWLAESIKTHGKEKGTQLLKQLWNFRNSYGDPSITPDLLATTTARTLIIHGDKDDIVPLSCALEMYKNIGGYKYLWVVPNGGHLPYMEPANQSDFLRRVIEFLTLSWDKKPQSN